MRPRYVALVLVVGLGAGCGESNPVTGPSPVAAYTETGRDGRIDQAIAMIVSSAALVPWAGGMPLGAWWSSLGVTVRVSADLQGAAGRQEGRTLWVLDPGLLTYPADRSAVVAIAGVLIHEARHISSGPHRCKLLDYITDEWSPNHAQMWWWDVNGRADVAAEIRRLSFCEAS